MYTKAQETLYAWPPNNIELTVLAMTLRSMRVEVTSLRECQTYCFHPFRWENRSHVQVSVFMIYIAILGIKMFSYVFIDFRLLSVRLQINLLMN